MAKYKVPTIQELLDSGVHFGHQVRRWHPKMEKYIYSVNKNVHIIDLEQTEKLLKQACDFLFETAKSGKTIIFVGTKKQSKEVIKSEAIRSGAFFVNERWVGGTITNYKTIKKNLDKLLGFMKGREDGSFDKYTKKERLMIDREIEKMTLVYGGIINLKGMPDVLVVIDPRREKTAVHEAKSYGLKVVSIVDTNADPSGVDFPIPGNDDAVKSVSVLVKALSDAVEEGYKEFDKVKKEMPSEAVKPEEKAAAAEAQPVVITASENPEAVKVEKEVEKEIIKEAEVTKSKPEDEISKSDSSKKRGRPKKEEKKEN